MPIPVSLTSTLKVTMPLVLSISLEDWMSTRPPSGVNFIAFLSRFQNTCCTCEGSTSAWWFCAPRSMVTDSFFLRGRKRKIPKVPTLTPLASPPIGGIDVDVINLRKLRKELKQHGLSTSGLKAQLQDRLRS